MRKTLMAIMLATAMSLEAQPSNPTSNTNTNTNELFRTMPQVSLVNQRAHRLGAGVILGEPTGASFKYWFSNRMAGDLAVGWAFHEESDLELHGDALWHVFNLIPVSKGKLPLYFGIGGRVKFRDHEDDRVGFRIPVGVDYLFPNAPVDAFAEVAPVIDFVPTGHGDFSAGVGIRYWF